MLRQLPRRGPASEQAPAYSALPYIAPLPAFEKRQATQCLTAELAAGLISLRAILGIRHSQQKIDHHHAITYEGERPPLRY